MLLQTLAQPHSAVNSTRIAEAAWCLYCGHEIVPAGTVQHLANEVDREFLEHDVRAENKNTSAVKQPLRDSFGDRLKDM